MCRPRDWFDWLLGFAIECDSPEIARLALPAPDVEPPH